MKFDAQIKRALDESPVPYQIVKSKDHYFAEFANGKRVVIAGNHGKQKWGEVVSTVRNIKQVGRSHDSQHSRNE
jgi:hypothetical protein